MVGGITGHCGVFYVLPLTVLPLLGCQWKSCVVTLSVQYAVTVTVLSCTYAQGQLQLAALVVGSVLALPAVLCSKPVTGIVRVNILLKLLRKKFPLQSNICLLISVPPS